MQKHGFGDQVFCAKNLPTNKLERGPEKKKDAFNEGPVSLSRRKVAPKSEESISCWIGKS